MNTVYYICLLIALSFAYAGTVLVGFFMSLAVVGKGRRWIWMGIATPLFLAMWALAKWVLTVWGVVDLGMFDYAIPFTAAALLVPLAHKFRRWSENRVKRE